MRWLPWLALGVLLGSCKPGTPGCETLCQTDDACMRAIAAEGISPMGSTKGDSGLCRGICSGMRNAQKAEKKLAKELGGTPDPNAPVYEHPCFPTAKKQ